MSLVDSWPSTLIRSNERLRADAEQQVGLVGVEHGVGLDEHEQRREARRDHPRALGLGAAAGPCRR